MASPADDGSHRTTSACQLSGSRLTRIGMTNSTATMMAITIMVAVLFVIPILVNLLPDSWHADVVRWLPSSAGDAITSTVSGAHPHMFSPWGELAVLGAYTVAALIAGFILFRKRDA